MKQMWSVTAAVRRENEKHQQQIDREQERLAAENVELRHVLAGLPLPRKRRRTA